MNFANNHETEASSPIKVERNEINSLSPQSIQIKSEKVADNRTIRGLESKLQLLQVDLSSLHDQLHSTSLENVRMQRELVTLRRDKLDLSEMVENLTQKLLESKEKDNQFQPKCAELSHSLTIAESKIQSQQKLISKYEFQLSQLNQDLLAMDRLKTKAESQAENEAQYLNRISQSLGDELKELTIKSHETENQLRSYELKCADLERSNQISTTHFQEKIESLNHDIRKLSDIITTKDERIQALLQQISTFQLDCENYENEIQILFQEKKEKSHDMNILTEAFEKRGDLINDLESTNLLLNSHLAKQVGTLKIQEETIQQLSEKLRNLEITTKKDIDDYRLFHPQYLAMTESHQTLQRQNETLLAENQVYSQKLSELSLQHETLQQEHLSLQSLHSSQSNELHGVTRLLHEITSNYQILQSNYQELQLNYEELQSHTHNITTQFKSLEKQHSELRVERDQLYEEFLEIRKENSSLKNVIRE